MKNTSLICFFAAMAGGSFCSAQMLPGQNTAMGQQSGGAPTAPNSFDVSGAGAKPRQDDPTRRGETPPPQLFGMELPLLNPANDTVSYNGGIFDVGNNAVVRERFEKFLQQMPDDSDKARRYRSLLNEMLKQTQRGGSHDRKYLVGDDALVHIGHSLFKASEYEMDGGQSGALASAIVSALDVQRKILGQKRENKKLDDELEVLRKRIVAEERMNAQRAASIVEKKNGKGAPAAPFQSKQTTVMSHAGIAEIKGVKTANKAAMEVDMLQAKVNYQAVLVALLMQRRFDHVVIGSRVYRHVFKDGDVKLNLEKKSKANDFFTRGMGFPPTVNAMDSMAANMRREVEQSISAVHGLLARNKLGEATQRLIAAVAIGEYMESVSTFPAAARQRIAEYWTLRKRALSALNSRDYDTVDKAADRMLELDADFDNSMLKSYVEGRKLQSDLALRNARKALREGNEEDFNRYINEAGTIWPLNPKIREGVSEIKRLDDADPVKDEFRHLYDIGEFRRIAKERERFKVVYAEPELAKLYEEVISLVLKMDGMLEQLKTVADENSAIGPCMAYEKLREWMEQDERFSKDSEMRLALKDYEARAHDFVQAIREAEEEESRSEYGSALACYLHARCIHPSSTLAEKGISRVGQIIASADYSEDRK